MRLFNEMHTIGDVEVQSTVCAMMLSQQGQSKMNELYTFQLIFHEYISNLPIYISNSYLYIYLTFCLFPANLPPLIGPLLRLKFILIQLEEIRRFLRMITSHVMECRGGDVVRLSLADKRVVFQEILDFRVVVAGLTLEDFPCFLSVFLVKVSSDSS